MRFNSNINANDVVKFYELGNSVKRCSEVFNCSRNVIVNRLRSVGITPRTRSESMYLRMSQTSFKDRQTLTKKANITLKGSKKTDEQLINNAISAERTLHKMKPHEISVYNSLKHFNCIRQKAIYKYNIDLMFGNVAMEIHVDSGSPLRKYTGEKIKYLLNSGYFVYVLWIKPGYVPNYCDFIRFLKFAQNNPTSTRVYRVVKSPSDIYSTGCLKSNEFTSIFLSI